MKSKVIYIDHNGSDKKICEVARVSTQSKGEEIEGLINYLMRNGHLSPFEFCFIEYIIEMPIFVARQFMRHRTFKYAEKSMRYYRGNGDDINFYHFDDRPVDVWFDKVSYEYDVETSTYSEPLKEDYEYHLNGISLKTYQQNFENGIPSERARGCLTQSMMTTVRVQCDLRNLMHFLKLRLDKHAQLEIREVAKQMFDIFKEHFPISSSAFEKYILNTVTLNQKEQILLNHLIDNKYYKAEDYGMSENEFEQSLSKLREIEKLK